MMHKYWNALYQKANATMPTKWLVHLAKEIANRANRRKRMQFYAQFLNSGDLCFDIGANTGNRTAVFAELGCKVVAIEPQEECFARLRKKFGKNRQVTLVKKAVAKKAGKTELYTCHADAISSTSKGWIEAMKKSGRYDGFEWSGKETAQATTLDELIKRFGKPEFCKIDVEGAELGVLRGLSRPVRHISFEFSTDYLPAALNCISCLADLGKARFNYSVGESMHLALAEWVDAKKIIGAITSLRDKGPAWGDIYAQFDIKRGRGADEHRQL